VINKKYFLAFACILSICGFQHANAQGASFSNVRVNAGVEMHIKYADNITFGEHVTTDRASTSSVISFASLPDANSVTGFVNGRAKVNSNSNSLFLPVGENLVSAVTLTTVNDPAQPVTALYSQTGGGNPNLHDSQLFIISETENWAINGNNSARLKLSWETGSGYDATASAYSLGVEDAMIAAWNGTQWIHIPSAADNGSTLQSGSITSTENIDFNSYSLFTIAFKNGCAELVTATGTVTYNGSWSGTPDRYMNVIINAPLTVNDLNSFAANSLEINQDIVLQDGAYIDVIQSVHGTGKIMLANEASFVQRSSVGDGPKIELIKQTRPMRKWDYAYWGTPIKENFIAQIANAKAVGYTTAAFDSKYKYVSEAGTSGSWQNLDAIVPGKGFITRIKPQAPFINETATAIVNFPIVGTANNGNVSVLLGNALTGNRSFNLLANPYPSAIDAGELLRSNPTLGGAVYLWTAKEFNSLGATADYAIWNLAGSVVTSPISQQPTGYIASGQSFMVKGLVAGGTMNFTNCMRVTGHNDNFFRISEPTKDRYWLNMSNGNGIFTQILVNYTEEATYGLDRLYDAPRNSVSPVQLYSFIETGKYAINSRPVFDATDVVPLGVSRTAEDAPSFTIALHQPEGVFAEGDVAILLHDKLLGVYTHLNLSSYSFTIDELQHNDRFEILYETEALGTNNPDFTGTAYMKIDHAQFTINATAGVNHVMIYDLTGRLVQQYEIGNTKYTAPFHHAQGIYIAKAKMENGTLVTQKIINGK